MIRETQVTIVQIYLKNKNQSCQWGRGIRYKKKSHAHRGGARNKKK